MNHIKRSAIKVLKELNNDLRYSALQSYIMGKGFIFIEFNTDNGDRVAKAYDIYNKCSNKNGMTIVKGNAKFVIVDGSLCMDDKIRVALHELGHVLLHFLSGGAWSDMTVIGRDNEAEAFVYEVLELSKHKLFLKLHRKIS